MQARHAVLAGALLGAVLGCRPAPVEAAVLKLTEFHQAGAAGVFLNETLVLHFSAPVDRSSVHQGSVHLSDAHGRSVAGTFEVEGASVLFHPKLPLLADLSDGGFQPGTSYRMDLRGFPFPDGLRGQVGEPLSDCFSFGFSTVDLGPSVFAPPLYEAPAFVRVEDERVGPVEPIRLRVDQAIDPRSLSGPAFELLDGTVPLPLRVTLGENGRDGALLELRALGGGEESLRALEPGAWYVLRLLEGASPPCTLGGIPVEVGWSASRLGGARISVPGPSLVRTVSFDDTGELWSVQPAPGVDGTADWGGGRVSIRYPRAAGTGAEGEVLLHEEVAPRDVHATRLRLPAPEIATLPAEGLVVLRSQGRMELAGALRRPAPASPAPPMTFPPGETLTEWLAEARARDPAWTVLIAGGDLVVSTGANDAGGIDVAGPLLFVSGGRLRIADSLHADALWKLSPGDVAGSSRPELQWVPSAVDPALPPEQRFRVDEPEENPLVEPLTFGVLSASFRPESGVASWHPGRFEAHSGKGRVRVRWLGQRFARDRVEEFGPVDDVLLLAGSDALRFRIDLTVPAGGGIWDPPTVDSVEFRWDAPLPGAAEER